MYLDKEVFFEEMGRQGQSLGFNNIIIGSGPSEQVLKCVESGNFDEEFVEPDLGAPCTRNSWNKLPLMSAAMDTVTEAETAIVMADGGGRGVIHAGLNPEDQYLELEKVKRRLNGFVDKPHTLDESTTFEQVHKLCAELNFTTFPVTDTAGRLVGIVTGHQIKRSNSPEDLVADKMIPLSEVKTSSKMVDIEEAYRIMVEENINTLPIVDDSSTLAGLYVFSDVKSIVVDNSGMRNVDGKGRYVGAIAVPTDDSALERVKLCEEYLTDGGGIVVVDTAHGDGLFAFKTLQKLKENFPKIDFLVGNVTNPESALLLARMGADGIKVGQASGGSCTTNEETGIGRGQVTAVWECVRALREADFDIPVCSDGGVRFRGDPAKAIILGAMSVMVGSRFGSTDEAPGEKIPLADGSFGKVVRGMGSLPALRASAAARQRYGDSKKMPLPEGKEDIVSYQGPLAPILEGFRMALRKSMVYAGAADISSFQRNTPIEFDASRR